MTLIHPTALVSSGAVLSEGVSIGPFCVVGEHVVLGANVRLVSHVVIEGHVTIAEGCTLYPFATVGLPPQDLKYKGEKTSVVIGARTVLREHVTIHAGTAQGRGVTKVGSDCFVMVGAHVGHDAIVGDGVVMANGVTLGGHVEVGERAILGGMCAVIQNARIGRNAIIGGVSAVVQDVIPYGLAKGDRARLSGLNLIGLKRSKLAKDEIQQVQNLYNDLFLKEDATFNERLERVSQQAGQNEQVKTILSFLREPTTHGICHARGTNKSR